MKCNVYLFLLLSVSGQLWLFLLYFTVKCVFWETVGSLSVTFRSSVSGLSVACRPRENQQSVEGSSSSQLPKYLRHYVFLSQMFVSFLCYHEVLATCGPSNTIPQLFQVLPWCHLVYVKLLNNHSSFQCQSRL